MAITDEVRRDIDACTQSGETFDTVFIVKSALLCDLDRIDAALAERYVELPNDANGEVIHIGDELDDGLDQSFTPKKVKMLMLEGDEWMLNFGGGWCAMKHHKWHHYHAPTVEDVLREMLCAWEDTLTSEGVDGIIAEYAKRLKLAGSDAE